MKAEFADISAVLFDIEGTTTPLEFVHRTLFSYAREKVEVFLKENSARNQVADLIDMLEKSYKDNSAIGKLPQNWSSTDISQRVGSAAKYVKWLISVDSKDPALKELQGLIWEEGYRNGQLHGEVYPDVPEVMERLNRDGIRMAIYSSGSALAQRLIFASTNYGDLTKYLSGFFDTSVGPKRDPKSYANIAGLLKIPSGEILFLSDIIEEITAARTSGLKAVQVVREGHNTSRDSFQPTISSLLELF